MTPLGCRGLRPMFLACTIPAILFPVTGVLGCGDHGRQRPAPALKYQRVTMPSKQYVMNLAMSKAIQAGTRANIWLYRHTNGRVGGRGIGPLPLLLLTVPGRSSGMPRTVPVAYLDHNGPHSDRPART